jgi:TM2 domain-containing membrane protein YozV
MLNRHITPGIRLHVYTEADRPVPVPMIKHELTEWKITRPGRGWWYKMQLFNTAHYAGPLLYFDLDTVIVGNIDWIWQQPTTYFWAIRDFKYLWNPRHIDINSSVMWWDTQKYSYVWDSFLQQDLDDNMLKYRGDQDYISDIIPKNQQRFFDVNQIKSWRWQCLDGGYDFQKKQHLAPNTGTQVSNLTSILVFHGTPKPDQITDSGILRHWQ